jgi:phosphatidate cytidylyltransferase
MEAEPTITPAGPSRPGRDLVAATVVGLVLAALLAAGLVLPPIALTVLVGGLLLAAHVELGRLLAGLGRAVHVDVLIVSTLVLLVATQTLGARGQAIGLSVLTIGALVRSLAERSRADVLGTVSRTVLLGSWLTGLASYALLLRTLDAPIVMLVTVLGSAAVSDIAAYGVGSRLGRRAIAPSVSPNKTWEGFVGGVIGAAVFAAIVLPLDTTSSVMRGLVVGATVGVAGFLGDLVASMVKRDLGVKDLGRLLPGHGGVLDRVDGLLLGLPVGYALLVLLP